jgi:transcriptional regulator with XRE-family HTH domain
VNGRLIAERRLALGISRADLARLTVLSWTLLTMLEETHEPPFVTLDAARRLARALAVDLNGIADSCHAPVAASDDVRLERLLASAAGAHTYAELAFAMEWPLQRVIAAADGLEHRLLDTGQALKTSPRGVRLASRGGRYTTCDLARLRPPPANLTKRLLESSQLSGMRLTDNATFSLEPEIDQLPTIGPVKRRRFNPAARPPGRFDGGRFGSSP